MLDLDEFRFVDITKQSHIVWSRHYIIKVIFTPALDLRFFSEYRCFLFGRLELDFASLKLGTRLCVVQGLDFASTHPSSSSRPLGSLSSKFFVFRYACLIRILLAS